MADPVVPVSWGELLDKISILEIKRERLESAAARTSVGHQLGLLERARAGLAAPPSGLAALESALKAVNLRLWEIEDEIRAMEARQTFDAQFIAAARAVYRNNDERGRIKRAIDELLRSDLAEQKQYTSYETR